jgi:ABC-type nitrate/sulfonate/bicarbonate transport system substrate-binding protein
MRFTISRRALVAAIAVSTFIPGGARAADALKEIHIDWATYNPVSIILKQKGLLEKEFAKDGIDIVWVQSAGSNKALEFLNAGSIDFGSTAGSAALVARINGNPIKSATSFHARNGRRSSRPRIPRSRPSPISAASASRSRAAPIRISSWCARCSMRA